MNLLQAWMSFRVYLKHPTSRTRTRTRLSESGLPLIELCHAPGNQKWSIPEQIVWSGFNWILFDQVSKIVWSGFKADFIESQGYSSISDYRIGRSANGSFVGWAGNVGLTTNQFFEQVSFSILAKSYFYLSGLHLGAPRWHLGRDHHQRTTAKSWKLERGRDEVSGRKMLWSPTF